MAPTSSQTESMECEDNHFNGEKTQISQATALSAYVTGFPDLFSIVESNGL